MFTHSSTIFFLSSALITPPAALPIPVRLHHAPPHTPCVWFFDTWDCPLFGEEDDLVTHTIDVIITSGVVVFSTNDLDLVCDWITLGQLLLRTLSPPKTRIIKAFQLMFGSQWVWINGRTLHASWLGTGDPFSQNIFAKFCLLCALIYGKNLWIDVEVLFCNRFHFRPSQIYENLDTTFSLQVNTVLSSPVSFLDDLVSRLQIISPNFFRHPALRNLYRLIFWAKRII